MRNKKSRGLCDDQFRLEKITKLKDPLEKLNRYIKCHLAENERQKSLRVQKLSRTANAKEHMQPYEEYPAANG